MLRLLRVFRIFKLTEYVAEYQMLREALAGQPPQDLVFLSAVIMVVLILGTLLYVVEGPENGFTDIPKSIYWAITTITTVGFGDITPKTDLGRLIASVMMLIGWGMLAVPTGIVTAEMTARRHARPPLVRRACVQCEAEGYGPEANFCQPAVPNFPRYLSLRGRRPRRPRRAECHPGLEPASILATVSATPPLLALAQRWHARLKSGMACFYAGSRPARCQ